MGMKRDWPMVLYAKKSEVRYEFAKITCTCSMTFRGRWSLIALKSRVENPRIRVFLDNKHIYFIKNLKERNFHFHFSDLGKRS